MVFRFIFLVLLGLLGLLEPWSTILLIFPTRIRIEDWQLKYYPRFTDFIGYCSSSCTSYCPSTPPWPIGMRVSSSPYLCRSRCVTWSSWMSPGWSIRLISSGVWPRPSDPRTRIVSSLSLSRIGHTITIYCQMTINRANLAITPWIWWPD